ncbi:sialate O-acetylesterase [Tropicimonas sp. TH_r6]|uniref:sialate O-acetylesterase n=1 Tax=Tropicimonas sp. TH_r6 TaxID=3082085 RepID=UPI00295510C2|nr:sialate O-acetylesterase [Tropicimonas sp. TH_r6]MDV7141143.1 sialate O-acetylesterase [Tropicimonas sp. TH_r6]
MTTASSIVRPLVSGMVRPITGSQTTTQVIILAGQSNMVGRASFDGGASYPDGVAQYDRNGQIVAASAPLDHHDAIAGDMGLDLQFAIDFKAAYPNVDLVFLPAAQGGTGFSDGQWGVGEPLYADLVTRANALFADNPSFQLGAILWHQGERDSGLASYRDELEATIVGLREEIAVASSATPFILGELLPDFSDASAENAAVNTTIQDVPNRMMYTATVDTTEPTRLASIGDGLHFDAASLRLIGSRYFDALPVARANKPTVPGIVTDLSAMAENQQVALAWSAPMTGLSPITDYHIERSLDGANWNTLSDAVSAVPNHTDSGLTNGTTYFYRVSAINAVGTGIASATASAMPDAGAATILSTNFACTTDDGTSHSFSDIDMGDGGTVFIAAACRGDTSADALSEMTIGGQTATLLELNKAYSNYIRFGYVTNAPAGAQDVVVTHGSVQSRLGIHVWVLGNVAPASAVAASGLGTDNAIDVFADGLVLGVATSINPASQNVDWIGLDERTEWTNYGDSFGSASADRSFAEDIEAQAVSISTDGNYRMTSLVSLTKA